MTDERRWSVRTAPMTGQTVRVDSLSIDTIPDPRSVFDPQEPRFAPGVELGRGGMGRVVEANDRVLGRTVAIKHSLATDPVNTARFEREVRITARLQHPGIVPILDAGRGEDGQPFYVMRKIDGEPLARRVDAARTVRDRLALVPALLAAVDATAYAHAQGVVHRDIKPWNILLGPFGESLLIDWGLARDLAGDPPDELTGDSGDRDRDSLALTRIGSAYGTPGFMAPEQARGEPADARADVYSLGATLFFLLAGGVPFVEATPTLIIAKVAAGTPPDLTRISDEVPAELVAIAGKALATDPAARYADAGELGADLRRFLGGQLVAAHRYTTRERVMRWVRRHRLVTAVAAVAIAVISIGAVISVRRVVAERDDANVARQLAETRAEERLVDRARSLVTTDPTSTIAVLRDLPASSPLWPQAREVARSALTGGVERLVTRHGRAVIALAVSPGGRIASGGSDGVQVSDAGGSRVVTPQHATRLGWLDDRKLVHAYTVSGGASTIAILDTETGTSTPIAGAFKQLAVDAGRGYVLDEAGSVTVFTAAGTPTAIAGTGFDAISAHAGRLAMLRRDLLVVIDRDGTRREVAANLTMRVFQVAISPSGKRVGASIFKGAVEWTLDSAAPPRTWPRSATGLGGIVYAGEQLCGWSNDGTGIVSYEGDRVLPRWVVPAQRNIPILTPQFAGGTWFVTATGRLAHGGPLGIVELPHRPVTVVSVATDPSGQRLVLGTQEGEVIVDDARAALPALVTIPAQTQVYAIGEGFAIVGREAGSIYNGEDPSTPAVADTLAILDLATGAQRALTPLGFGTQVVVTAHAIVGSSGRGVFAVWTRDGTERYRKSDAWVSNVNQDVAYHTTAAGDVIVVALAGVLEPRTFAHFATRDLTGMSIVDGGVTLSVASRAHFIDASGPHLLAGIPESSTSIVPDRAGGWWFVKDYSSLWHLRDGVATEVAMGQRIRRLRWASDRLLATSETTQFQLAADGRVIQATSGFASAKGVDGGTLLATPLGAEVVMTAAAVRRLVRTPFEPASVFATADARELAALLVTDDRRVLAWWRDPVPVEPLAVQHYLGTITNARLGAESDALQWDP
ncbi:MAG: serine/threonine-protein kinase [Kofleriaceae bacterium]